MIDRPLARRALLGAAIAGPVALSGCSLHLGGADVPDGEAADRRRLRQARDLSDEVIQDIDGLAAGSPSLATRLAAVRSLHVAQSAKLSRASRSAVGAASTSPPTPVPDLAALRAREEDLHQTLRSLAQSADRGEVAQLLASAAAGVAQVLTRWPS